MTDEMGRKHRLIIASNRLPIVLKKDKNGDIFVTSGSGGLVTALAPVLKDRGGLWIGWTGIPQEDITRPLEPCLKDASRKWGYKLLPVNLTKQEIDNYYYGFANEVLWPLFHDLPSHCNFNPEYWNYYKNVNEKFAKTIAENCRYNDFVWIHDYHLVNVAKKLREMNVNINTAYFLHIPFPPLDVFLNLPWRFEILNSLLQYDLIGFQTIRDRRNFVHCVRKLLRGIRIYGKGQVIMGKIKNDNRQIRIGAFPISIDFYEFENMARSQEVSDRAWYIHEDLPNQHIILGVDRLDYTKGIINRLRAFQNAMRRYPELIKKLTFIQVVVPSRQNVPEYQNLRREIEQTVGEINGEFTRSGWVPIHYIYRSLVREELLAYYRTAEIALVTPLKDGMNLVAKEYCASNLEETGVLI
ncbi:trehalose-6-phosphate synthase, partial [bacterium]